MSKNVIIAPHPDDEIIGCFSLFLKKSVEAVYYGEASPKRRLKEAAAFCQAFGARCEVVSVLPHLVGFGLFQDTVLYFPDPVFETHPDHRMWGAIGERFLRTGWDVVFYSTNMAAPYIYEVPFSKEKKQALERFYPSQRDLWRWEHKYFLFEGSCKWLGL